VAGAGYKAFADGDVLTAAQVQTYLQDQAVMRFADSSARTSALGGSVAEGMVSYLQDTDAVEVYDGSAWTAVGATPTIVQVVSTTMTGTFSTNSNTFQDVTGLTASITPSSATNKVIVIASVSASRTDSSAAGQLDLLRDGSSIITPASPGSRQPVLAEFNLDGANDLIWMVNFGTTLLDSPATTSSVTYKVQARITSSGFGPIYVNRSATDSNNDVHPRGVSSITLLEVTA